MIRKQDNKKGYITRGDGPGVVLLHSSMSSKDQWHPLANQLSSAFRLTAIDLAGYGDNCPPANPEIFSTKDEIHLIQKVLNEKVDTDGSFHLVGHSYGGAIALKLARQIPEKIKSLTVFEPVVFHLLNAEGNACNEIKNVVKNIGKGLKEKNKPLATKIFIDYWSGNGTFDRLNAETRDMFICFIEKVFLDFQALFNESLSLDDYKTIDIPVCMIKGEKSPESSLEIFDIFTEILPNRTIHTVPGGHMSPITHFKAVNNIIFAFLMSQLST